MYLRYRASKKLSSFLQKYKLKTQFKNVQKLFLFLLVVWLIGSFLTILSQWIFLPEAHKSYQDYLQYFWIVIIELVSGFDIPEVPMHTFSLLISIIMLVMGIIVVGLFTGQIISMFVHVMQKNEFYSEKPDTFQFDKPIIICGMNRKLNSIIKNLRKCHYSQKREIIIIDKDADQIKKNDEKYFDDIWYLKGDPASRDVLKKAIGKQDCRVIILAKDSKSIEYIDSNAINAALAIEAFDESVHTVIEIANNKNIEHFKCTKINDWICVSEYSLKLISQSALQPGMAKVYSRLLGHESKDEKSTKIYFSSTPLVNYFTGKSYNDINRIINRRFKHLDITLIGFAKYIEDDEKKKLNLKLRNSNYFIQINPVRKKNNTSKILNKTHKVFFGSDTKLNPMDKLIYLANNHINFDKVIKFINNKNGERK